MLKYFVILFCLCISARLTSARIIETADIKKIETELASLPQESLVTFDVAGVLFWPKDQIFIHNDKKEYKKYITALKTKYGNKKANKLISIILKERQMILVDDAMPSLISSLQARGVKTIALTSGYTGNFGKIKKREDLRIKTLKKLGIDFSSSFPDKKLILTETKDSDSAMPASIFKKGILFASRNDKGQILKLFLNQIGYSPTKIVHIDNSKSRVQEVENYANSAGIEYLGIVFIKDREKLSEKLDTKIADKQFEILESEKTWISDEITKCIVYQKQELDVCRKQNGTH
jgi:hypothetical protein